jgi:putative phosphonate metabolism protein
VNPRYALYYSPERHSPWWEFGAHWLGRDEYSDAPLTHPHLSCLNADEHRRFTAEPRRYGFHATLLAPFHLACGHSLIDLLGRIEQLAKQLKPAPLGELSARSLGGFVALTPAPPTRAVTALAEHCVKGLDDLRAPLSESDLARRQGPHLDAREQALLQRYGYAHVLDRFQLHMTLSGPLDAVDTTRLLTEVEAPVARLNQSSPLVLDRLCLFIEPQRGAPFLRLADMEVKT